MRLTVDLDTLELIQDVNNRRRVSRVSVKRGDGVPLQIAFAADGASSSLGSPFTLAFAVKEQDKFDGDLIVFEDSFSLNGSTGMYEGSPSFNTVALNGLLNSGDSNDTNDLPFVDLMGEVTWTQDSSAPRTSSTFTVRVYNDIYKAGDGTPSVAGDPDNYVRIPMMGDGPPNTILEGTESTDPPTVGTWLIVGEENGKPAYKQNGGSPDLFAQHSAAISEFADADGWEIRLPPTHPTLPNRLLWAVVAGGGEDSDSLPLTGWLAYLPGSNEPTGIPEFALTGTVEASLGQEYLDLDSQVFWKAVGTDPMVWKAEPTLGEDNELIGPIVLTPQTEAASASYVGLDGEMVGVEGDVGGYVAGPSPGTSYDLPGFAFMGDGSSPGEECVPTGRRPTKYIYCDIDGGDPGVAGDPLVIDPRYDYVVTYANQASGTTNIQFQGTPSIGQRFTIIRGSMSGTLQTSEDQQQQVFDRTGSGDYDIFYCFVGGYGSVGNDSTCEINTNGVLEFEVVPAVGSAASDSANGAFRPLMGLVRWQFATSWSAP